MTTNIIEIKNLMPLGYADREAFFLNENNEAQALIDAVKKYYSSLTFDGADGKTPAGRKAIKDLAAELNKKIKEIDNAGKDIVSILKAKPSKIDATRKKIRDELGALYDEIRRPVIEYEAEQARIKAEEEAKIEAQRKAEQEELSRLRAEKEQRYRDARIAEEAAEKARLEADNRAREAELALQREREETARKEREKLAEIQRTKEEEARRIADVEHKRQVKYSAFKCLLENSIDKDTAIKIVNMIDDGKIKNVFIKY